LKAPPLRADPPLRSGLVCHRLPNSSGQGLISLAWPPFSHLLSVSVSSIVSEINFEIEVKVEPEHLGHNKVLTGLIRGEIETHFHASSAVPAMTLAKCFKYLQAK